MKYSITSTGKISFEFTKKQIELLSDDCEEVLEMDLSMNSIKNFQLLIIKDLFISKLYKIRFMQKPKFRLTLSAAETAALAFALPINADSGTGFMTTPMLAALKDLRLLCYK